MQSFIEDQPLVRHDDEGKPTLSLRIFEEERYDDRFPDHPLSRVRRLLGQIEESVTLSERVKAAPAFVFPPE